MSLIFDNYKFNEKYNLNNSNSYNYHKQFNNYEKQRRKVLENTYNGNIKIKLNESPSINKSSNHSEYSNPNSPFLKNNQNLIDFNNQINPGLDPFSDKYYLNNPQNENFKMIRKPSPVPDAKLSFSHDNYLNEKIKQEEKALIGRIEKLRALENQFIYKSNNSHVKDPMMINQYQKKYDYKTVFDLDK